MEQKAGAQIGKRAFIQSAIILLVLMIAAGVLTRVLPAGTYDRYEAEGRILIDPGSYRIIERPDYPAWRWFTAPVEVLWGEDSLIIITIIVFILLVSGAFAVLEKCGILTSVLAKIVNRFRTRRYTLLLVVSLFFMLLGGFFGILEEIIPLVPLMIALSYSLGWDALVGLGMSVLATNIGFSAAVTNPFTIGVAQKLAGLPLFQARCCASRFSLCSTPRWPGSCFPTPGASTATQPRRWSIRKTRRITLITSTLTWMVPASTPGPGKPHWFSVVHAAHHRGTAGRTLFARPC